MGVDPGYVNSGFYARIMDIDSQRVKDRFDKAMVESFDIKERSVDIAEILNHLAKHGPVICLANANVLACDVGHLSLLCGNKDGFVPCLSRHCVNSYQGPLLALGGL